MNNIQNKILIFGLSTLLIGCSQSATSVLDRDPLYAQNMQYTKVLKVVDKDVVNAIFNVTYLNSVDTQKWDNEHQNFLIGTYTVDNNDSQYKLTLNDAEPISSTIIEKEDAIYKNIAFRNHWGKYALVTFKNTEQKTLNLTYTYNNDKNISTTFIKE